MQLLSKSQYTRGLQCHKALWMYRHRRELMTAPDEAQQRIFDQGTAFGRLAQERFPGGVYIAADHLHPEEALAETQGAIAAGARVLYEAAFLHDDVLVRVDVLVKDGGAWHLIEVKSSTEVEPVYLHDVAVQRYVLAGAGFRAERAFVAHVNTEYVRRGPLDPQALFRMVDVTEDSSGHLAAVPGLLGAMKIRAAQAEAPDVPIGGHCAKPYPCAFEDHCWAHVPAYSVFNLAGARMDKKLPLWEAGIKTLADLPAHVKLTDNQAAQVRAAKTGQVHVDRAGIAALLRNLVYPLHFLDFEAVNPVLPPYDGLRPYQVLPFQASVHYVDRPGAPVEHFEYLADGLGDPRQPIVHFLSTHVAPTGSVIAYNKSYEGGILKGLAAAEAGVIGQNLMNVEARLWDLADPFRKALYVHPAFRGSWSLKKVLPVLVPGLTYEGLAIRDGVAAQVAYERLMDPATPAEARAQIAEDLKAYCGQDTLAMVRLLEHLEAATQQAAA